MLANSIKENWIIDFTISHNISNSWYMQNYHFHDAFEILLALSDDTEIFIEDNMYSIKKGDLFIMNNMELHKTAMPNDISFYDRYVIMFNPKYIVNFSDEGVDLLDCFLNKGNHPCNKLHLSEDQLQELLSLLKKIEYYNNNSVFGSELLKKTAFIETLILINSFYDNITVSDTLKPSISYKRVEPILEYINENLSSNLSLDKLAAIFFINKHYLGHIFKSATSFSVNEYIINRRILKSRELLKQNFTVTEVAEMVGFNSDCHFIRTFKKFVGISPKQYAKKK